MARTNDGVAKAWIEGRIAESGHMRTDGRSIWSYGLMIGHICPDNRILVRNAQAPSRHNPGGRYYSMTTSSKHMPPVISAAFGARADYGHPVELIDDDKFQVLAYSHGARTA